jgi:hypothetical protein
MLIEIAKKKNNKITNIYIDLQIFKTNFRSDKVDPPISRTSRSRSDILILCA